MNAMIVIVVLSIMMILLLATAIMRLIMYFIVSNQLKKLDMISEYTFISSKELVLYYLAYRNKIDEETTEYIMGQLDKFYCTISYLKYIDNYMDGEYIRNRIQKCYMSLDVFDDTCKKRNEYKIFKNTVNIMKLEIKQCHGFRKVISEKQLRIKQYSSIIPKEELENAPKEIIELINCR